MDVQWGTLDNEGKRLRGKDTTEIVSRKLCLKWIVSYLLSVIDICKPFVGRTKLPLNTKIWRQSVHVCAFRRIKCDPTKSRKDNPTGEVKSSAVPKRTG